MTLRDMENGTITINYAISRRMKELAYLKNLPLSEIIRRGKLNQSTISEIISERSKHPRISTIMKFCNGCGITLEEFFQSEFFRNNLVEDLPKPTTKDVSEIAPIDETAPSQVDSLVEKKDSEKPKDA